MIDVNYTLRCNDGEIRDEERRSEHARASAI